MNKDISKNIVIKMIINPFYAIDIDPTFTEKHEKIIDRQTWIEANTNLIKEIGSKNYLTTLLSVLEGEYV